MYKGVTICTKLGDLTEEEVDAIVNPANSLMIMGGGVARAIKKKGGTRIEREARIRAPIPIGRAIATNAGRLKTKYVIHAPTMPRPAMRTSEDRIYKATKAALSLASELGITSIAFPGMGTGVRGIRYNRAAEIMLKAIKECIDEGTSIKRISLVAIDPRLKEVFEANLEKLVTYGGQIPRE